MVKLNIYSDLFDLILSFVSSSLLLKKQSFIVLMMIYHGLYGEYTVYYIMKKYLKMLLNYIIMNIRKNIR